MRPAGTELRVKGVYCPLSPTLPACPVSKKKINWSNQQNDNDCNPSIFCFAKDGSNTSTSMLDDICNLSTVFWHLPWGLLYQPGKPQKERHRWRILIRYLNHLNWFLAMQRNSGCTLLPFSFFKSEPSRPLKSVIYYIYISIYRSLNSWP